MPGLSGFPYITKCYGRRRFWTAVSSPSQSNSVSRFVNPNENVYKFHVEFLTLYFGVVTRCYNYCDSRFVSRVDKCVNI